MFILFDRRFIYGPFNFEVRKVFGYKLLAASEEYLEKVNIVQPTKALMNSSLYKSMPYSAVFTQDMERGHIVYFAENSARLVKQLP